MAGSLVRNIVAGSLSKRQRKQTTVRRVPTVCLVFVACAAWIAGQVRAEESANRPIPAADPPHVLVIFIGGIDSDPTPAQIAGTELKNRGNSGMYQLCGEIQDDRIACEYFNWNGTRAGDISAKKPPLTAAIINRIRAHLDQNPSGRTVVVGNSWGGHTAWESARELVNSPRPLAIDRVIFLDPSSTGRAIARRPNKLPINIKQAVNYYTHNVFCWGPWTDERIRSIDLGDPALGYVRNGKPAYASSFDPQAHIAAEWDQRIHAEIKADILRFIADDDEVTKE